MSKKVFSPTFMTVKIHYGKGHRFKSAKELLEFLANDWSISAHYDVFEERDQAKSKLDIYREYVERHDTFNDFESYQLDLESGLCSKCGEMLQNTTEKIPYCVNGCLDHLINKVRS